MRYSSTAASSRSGTTQADATGAWTAGTGPLANGVYSITAATLDPAGNKSALSGVLTLTIDSTLPVATLTSPTAGAVVSGTVNLAATATDAVGIMQVDFKVDGVTKGSSTTGPYNYAWSSSTVPNGIHTLSAVATDIAGNVSVVSSASVDVENGGGGHCSRRAHPASPPCAATAW